MGGYIRGLFPSFIAIMILFVQPAWAQGASDSLTCETASGDIALNSCGRLIASKRHRGRDLAKLYFYRGNAYHAKEDYGRAIADYSEAIRLVPKLPTLLYNRGIAYLSNEDYDRAIADFSEAIRLDPKNARIY